jgi:hypothetical protein
MTTHGFPNLFMMYGPNTNNGSVIYQEESQARYISKVVSWMATEQLARVEVREDVETEYNEWLDKAFAKTLWVTGCNGVHDYYHDASGRIATQWPFRTREYRRRTRRPVRRHFLVRSRPSSPTPLRNH